MHWREFIGGDIVISPPYACQVWYHTSDIPVVLRIDEPVDPRAVDELSKNSSISVERTLKAASRARDSVPTARHAVHLDNSLPAPVSSEQLSAILCCRNGNA